MKKREGIEPFGLSFLDIISCGFGAVVMLVLIFQFSPTLVEDDTEEDKASALDAVAALLSAQKDLEASQVEQAQAQAKQSTEDLLANSVDQTLARLRAEQQANQQSLSELRKKLDDLNTRLAAIKPAGLSKGKQENEDSEVAGIPVDRKYVIFVVDTSGSMRNIWRDVMNKMEHILEIHPKLVGFQIINDNGKYLFSGYKKRWITDTASMRSRTLKLFKGWGASSSSNPVEGIKTALRDYKRYRDDISMYVLGDDFTGSNFDSVLDTINQLNQNKARIHGLSFISPGASTDRFGTLMREISRQNNGTFLAL